MLLIQQQNMKKQLAIHSEMPIVKQPLKQYTYFWKLYCVFELHKSISTQIVAYRSFPTYHRNSLFCLDVTANLETNKDYQG